MPAQRAPLGLAAFLGIPIFFSSLMAVSLAIEKPRVVEWSRPGGRIARIFHDPTTTLEAKIWLLAMVPALLLVLVGYAASFLPRGLYVTCAATVVIALAVTYRVDTWQGHHAARFPYGEDLLADQTNSSSLARGEWEQNAADTAHSLANYAIVLALGAAVLSVLIELRRRRRRPRLEEPVLLETGGAPQITGG